MAILRLCGYVLPVGRPRRPIQALGTGQRRGLPVAQPEQRQHSRGAPLVREVAREEQRAAVRRPVWVIALTLYDQFGRAASARHHVDAPFFAGLRLTHVGHMLSVGRPPRVVGPERRGTPPHPPAALPPPAPHDIRRTT